MSSLALTFEAMHGLALLETSVGLMDACNDTDGFGVGWRSDGLRLV